MESNDSVKALLEQISLQEGAGFTCDTEHIYKDLAAHNAVYSNIGVRLLSVIGGLLVAIFLLGFMLLGGLASSETGMVIVGFGLIVAAVWVNKIVNNILLDTSAIAIYIGGFALLIFGLVELHTAANMTISVCIVTPLVVIVISGSAMLVFISTLIINTSIVAFFGINDLFNSFWFPVALFAFAYTWLSLSEARIIAAKREFNTRYRPVRMAMLLSLLGTLVFFNPASFTDHHFSGFYTTSVLLIIGTLYSADHILRSLEIASTRNRLLLYALVLVCVLPTLAAPGIAASLLVVVLSFYRGSRAGFSIALISFIFFISQFYYFLHFSLLLKSILLLIPGLVFTMLLLAYKKQLNTYEKI